MKEIAVKTGCGTASITNNIDDSLKWTKRLLELNPDLIDKIEKDQDFANIHKTDGYKKLKNKM